jgi:hypothetical protein
MFNRTQNLLTLKHRKALVMKEQRQLKRFLLSLPVRIETIASEKKQIFKFKTRDISSAGAFIDTTEKFSEGARFKIDLTVPSERIKELTGALSLLSCEGIVVRSTEDGMAVCFNGNCQILRLKGL